MTTFYPGNAKLIGLAEQADADTPASAPYHFLQVYDFSADPVRAQGPLEETDRSTQQGANHVTAFTPALSFGIYGRPSLLDVVARSVLWSGSATLTSHSSTSTPSNTPIYWTVWEIEPGLYTNRYDGCVATACSFQGQDEGQTELRVTGWQWLALGYQAGISEPSLPAAVDELPYLFAEATVSYDSVSAGLTSAFTLNINRNAKKIQGDNGYRGLAVVPGKLQVDGTLTRYVTDDDSMRAVNTGSTSGTALTTDIYEQQLDIQFDRPADSVSLLISAPAVAYPTREQAVNLDGSPLAEVLGFQTQPQATLAGNLSIVNVG